MKYDYEKLEEIVTERLKNLDINEVAKFLSTSVDAIEYRDTFLSAEFIDWLETFDEGGIREEEDVFDYPEGRSYLTTRDDLGWEVAETFFFPVKINEDNFEMLREVYEGKPYLEDELYDIIPTALELTRTMDGC